LRSQIYHPFPTDSAEWSVLSYIGTIPELGHFYQTTHYGILGDTTINNKIYHKVFSSTAALFNPLDINNAYEGAFREINKVVIWVKNGMLIEDTLYDFNLNIGDLLTCEYCLANNYFTLTDSIRSTDSIQLGATFHKRYHTTVDSITTFLGVFSNSLVEGVGGLAGKKVFPYEACSEEEKKILLCFKRRGVILYQNTILNTCYYANNSNSLEESTPIKKIKSIYPNPSNGKFSIQFNQLEQKAIITIRNEIGKVILKDKLNKHKAEIDILKESNGIYFIGVTFESSIEVYKVIKN
jgi:hypothetical protein